MQYTSMAGVALKALSYNPLSAMAKNVYNILFKQKKIKRSVACLLMTGAGCYLGYHAIHDISYLHNFLSGTLNKISELGHDQQLIEALSTAIGVWLGGTISFALTKESFRAYNFTRYGMSNSEYNEPLENLDKIFAKSNCDNIQLLTAVLIQLREDIKSAHSSKDDTKRRSSKHLFQEIVDGADGRAVYRKLAVSSFTRLYDASVDAVDLGALQLGHEQDEVRYVELATDNLNASIGHLISLGVRQRTQYSPETSQVGSDAEMGDFQSATQPGPPPVDPQSGFLPTFTKYLGGLVTSKSEQELEDPFSGPTHFTDIEMGLIRNSPLSS